MHFWFVLLEQYVLFQWLIYKKVTVLLKKNEKKKKKKKLKTDTELKQQKSL